MVVETIQFDEDEDDELPMLLTQRDVVLMNKAGPLEEDVDQPAAQLANGDAEVHAMPTVGLIHMPCLNTCHTLPSRLELKHLSCLACIEGAQVHAIPCLQ